MRLGDPSALWLMIAAALALGALVWGAWQRQRTVARLGDRSVLSPLLADVSQRRRRLRAGLLVLAVIGIALSTLRPQWGAHTELARHRGLDVVFALDVSRSMLARDVLPDRLTRAKAEIAALSEQLGGNRVGLIAFAGTAFVQCPFTTDRSALKMFLNALTPDTVPQGGTAIAKALAVADRLFSASLAQSEEGGRKHAQVLVLITDGEDHEGDVEMVAGRLKEDGVTTFVVGVGSEAGEPIPLLGENSRVTGYQKDKGGRPVLTRLDSSGLSALAEAAGGISLISPRVDESLATVAREIDKLKKSEFESRMVVHYRERFQWPLALGLAALLLATVTRERKSRGGEKR
jgi:Ca-activated chloride channel family protein